MTRQEALKVFDDMSEALHVVFCGYTCTCPKEYDQAREVFAHGLTPEPSEIVTNADPMVISIPYYVPAPSLLDRLCRCGHALRHHEGEAGDPDTSCEECDCECWMPAPEPEELCPRCEGRGEYVEREDMTWDCPRCDGTGRVSKEAPSPSAAPAPAGGDLIGEPCPNCRGNGEIHHLTGGVSSCDDCNSTGRLAPKEGT